MPTLIIQLRDGGSAFHQFAEQTVTIGRAGDSTIQIDDPSVAERHAELSFRNGRFHLRALGAPPLTWVGGVAVSTAEIAEACALRFGDIECVFKPDFRAAAIEKPAVTPRPAAPVAADAVGQMMEQAREISVLIKERDVLQKDHEKLAAKISGLQRERELCGREIRRWWAQFEQASQANQAMETEVRLLREASAEQARHLAAVMADRDQVVEELIGLLSAQKQMPAPLTAPAEPAPSTVALELAAKLEATQRRVDELLAERVEMLVEKATRARLPEKSTEPFEHILVKRELDRSHRHLADVCETLDATIAAHVAATARVTRLMRELDKRDQRIAQLTMRYTTYPRPAFSHQPSSSAALLHG